MALIRFRTEVGVWLCAVISGSFWEGFGYELTLALGCGSEMRLARGFGVAGHTVCSRASQARFSWSVSNTGLGSER